jgi:hypothetical protein
MKNILDHGGFFHKITWRSTYKERKADVLEKITDIHGITFGSFRLGFK